MEPFDRHCAKALDKLYVYLDGETTWYSRMRVRWHLRRCPPCYRRFHFEERFKAVVRERAVDDPPDEFVERLRAFLREASED